jgi:hypothetical protein
LHTKTTVIWWRTTHSRTQESFLRNVTIDLAIQPAADRQQWFTCVTNRLV